jgi:hypothetical protein
MNETYYSETVFPWNGNTASIYSSDLKGFSTKDVPTSFKVEDKTFCLIDEISPYGEIYSWIFSTLDFKSKITIING